MRAVIVKVSTLQRLTLKTRSEYPSVQHVIVTPSLKYLKIYEDGDNLSYIIEDMPKLEEAVIDVAHFLDELLRSMTSVKHLSVRQITNLEEDQVTCFLPYVKQIIYH